MEEWKDDYGLVPHPGLGTAIARFPHAATPELLSTATRMIPWQILEISLKLRWCPVPYFGDRTLANRIDEKDA
jgi:hypothetical protein